MSEIIYKLFFFLILMIFFSVGFLVRLKLNYWKQYHGLDFISIYQNFQINTGGYNYKTNNIIYIHSDIPNQCIGEKKHSINCLSALKNIGGVYNGLAFFSGTNSYK